MTYRVKKRILLALLAAFLVWPFIHRALVTHYLVNPWRLFGWAMYCVPDHPASARFFAVTSDGAGQLVYPDDPQARAELSRFLAMHVQIGRLTQPDSLASLLLSRYPKIDQLQIEVSQPVYDPETASFEVVVDRYYFERSP